MPGGPAGSLPEVACGIIFGTFMSHIVLDTGVKFVIVVYTFAQIIGATLTAYLTVFYAM